MSFQSRLVEAGRHSAVTQAIAILVERRFKFIEVVCNESIASSEEQSTVAYRLASSGGNSCLPAIGGPNKTLYHSEFVETYGYFGDTAAYSIALETG